MHSPPAAPLRPPRTAAVLSPAERAQLAVMRAGGRLFTEAFRQAHRVGLLAGDSLVAVHEDLPYGDDPRQRVDLYLPRRASSPTPLVVFVHGGGWIAFDRKLNAALARTLASQGVAVACPGYRLLPDVSRAVQRADVSQAIVHVLAPLARRHGLDAERWLLGGESAGAHLALRALQRDAPELPRPAGFLGLFGYYDLDVARGPRLPRFQLLLRCVHQGDSPQHVSVDHGALRPLQHDVPVLLMHGTADGVAPMAQSQRLHAYLRATDTRSELALYPGADHGFLYRTHGAERRQAVRAYRRIFRFLARTGVTPRAKPRAA